MNGHSTRITDDDDDDVLGRSVGWSRMGVQLIVVMTTGGGWGWNAFEGGRKHFWSVAQREL